MSVIELLEDFRIKLIIATGDRDPLKAIQFSEETQRLLGVELVDLCRYQTDSIESQKASVSGVKIISHSSRESTK